jgi:uncharacterized membrane protein
MLLLQQLLLIFNELDKATLTSVWADEIVIIIIIIIIITIIIMHSVKDATRCDAQ